MKALRNFSVISLSRIAALNFLAIASLLFGGTALANPQNATSTVLGASSLSVSSGTAVTLTATVTSGGGNTAVTPGLVIFCDASATFCEGPATPAGPSHVFTRDLDEKAKHTRAFSSRSRGGRQARRAARRHARAIQLAGAQCHFGPGR